MTATTATVLCLHTGLCQMTSMLYLVLCMYVHGRQVYVCQQLTMY